MVKINEMITGQHRYVAVDTKTGEAHDFPVVTLHHMRWCKDGLYNIIDAHSDRECIRGRWINTKNN